MTSHNFPHLFEPLEVGGLKLKNRIIMAPLTRNRDIVPREDLHVPYYAERAGVGLIISEATLISPQGPEWTYMPGIYSEEQVQGWKKVTDAVHARGGLMFCQLHHVGRIAHPDTRVQRELGLPALAPSAIAARGGKYRNVPGAPGYAVPKAIEDPDAIIAQYGNAARRAKEAGFDGVELHMANGYLLHTFLEAHSNRRTDEYGGSVENRMRFPLACLAAASEHFPYNRIAVRLSPCGGINDMGELGADGNPSEEAAKATYIPFCAKLDTLGLAFVEVMRYWAGMDAMFEGKPRGVDWDCFGHLRPVLRNTLMFASANYSPEESEEWIRDKRVDALVIGRPLLYNADYVEKVRAGRTDELYQEQPGDEYWWYKWRNNDRRDGYLNWPGRAKDDVANSGRDRIALMME